MGKTCKTCLHWGLDDTSRPMGLRRCSAVPQLWDATTWDEDDFEEKLSEWYKDCLAFAEDGEHYSARLLTMPDFGCVMHEAGPNQEVRP